MMGTPSFFSGRARLSGVCPPNCTIRPLTLENVLNIVDTEKPAEPKLHKVIEPDEIAGRSPYRQSVLNAQMPAASGF
jgi:hypothetical protein